MSDDTGEIGREAAEAVGFENIKVGGGGPSFLDILEQIIQGTPPPTNIQTQGQ